jgi:hypothetical protein
MPKVGELHRVVLGLAAVLLPVVAFLLTGASSSQAEESAPPGAARAPAAESSPAPAPMFSPAQLDQMLAPIALYPDTLLGQVLMAATYPLDVVQADRWLEDPSVAALSGADLAAALTRQAWDPSVKSLTAFPSVLRMLDQNLAWTEQLGNAFLASQAAVLDSVQRLRHEAQSAGHLQASPQAMLGYDGDDIEIAPTASDNLYVPVYDSNVAYGAWPYPDYPPYSFPNSFDGILIEGPQCAWYSVAIVAPMWGWESFDWHRRRVVIDGPQFSALQGTGKPVASGPWHHNPMRRGGVPIRDVATRSPVTPPLAAVPDTQAWRDARGYPSKVVEAPGAAARMTPTLPLETAPPARAPVPTRAPPRPAEVAREVPPTPPVEIVHESRPTPPAPTLESFGRGVEVQAQAQRGNESRQSVPAAAPAAETHAGGGGDKDHR